MGHSTDASNGPTHTEVNDILNQSEFLWWPYRSLTKALLHTHHDSATFMEINRKLADELREIVHREQNFVIELSEAILSKRSGGASLAEREKSLPLKSIEVIFENAITGVREFGRAMTEAQIHAIEALRDHARDVANKIDHPIF